MSDMLSQEEIDALLKGTDVNFDDPPKEVYDFTDVEKDAIGEIGNISMGTAATTLSTLLGHKVTITTPRVSVITMQELAQDYPIPFVAVEVSYKEGIQGMNLLIIKVEDVKIITDLMMGGKGVINNDEPLSELHISAISEAMNQMVGSSSTALSEMFSKKIDINPPRAFEMDLQSQNVQKIFSDDKEQLVRISFKMEIEGLIDSEIMQLIPIDFAKEMIELLMPNDNYNLDIETETSLSGKEKNDNYNLKDINYKDTYNLINNGIQYENTYKESFNTKEETKANKKVNVQPVQFQSFDKETYKGIPENIALIQDVPLKVTVELGRTVKRINEVLEFGPGTIIELDKLVGEPLDILVNGQYVAKGEVVVIDENYGIRITDIVNPSKRFAKI